MEKTQNGPSEMPVEEGNLMEFEDPNHTVQIFKQLNELHKRGQFCDAKLIVGEHETGIHRAILGSASRFFFDMFMRGGEDGKNQNVFKLKEVKWEIFHHLLDFIYTGRMSVPEDQVKAVYKVSQQLRISSATEACVQYLVKSLTPDNCLGVRSFAADQKLREQVNNYIASNIQAVTNSKKFYGLTRINIEIVATNDDLVSRTSNDAMMDSVVAWLKTRLASDKNNLERLAEDVLVLYQNPDSSLTDCIDVDDTALRELKEDEMVQDYKKNIRMKQRGKKVDSVLSPDSKATANYRKFSINPENPIQEMEWAKIASYKTKDRTYMTIAMLNGTLVTISVHYRTAVPASSGTEDPDSPVHNGNSKLFDRYDELQPLAGMSTNRCGFGLKALNGCLFACGGYDRGECLKSTEVYNFEKNTWTLLGNMKSARGRFSIGIHDNLIYACGGSSGNADMKTVECYDSESGKWQQIAESPAKASPGIAVYQGNLYVIGGCSGQKTVATCEMLDLATKNWSVIQQMKSPRFQVAVTVFKEKIYAIGGTNGWKCLNEVEVYDPQTNSWSNIPPMKIARRGAGVAVYNGKIFVVGGNDGMTCLNSTEIFDPETNMWSLGPTLSVPRANCGVATLNNRLFAVGGFSGKKFLNCVEFLDLENSEYWCCHLPSKLAQEIRRQSSDCGDCNDVVNGDDTVSSVSKGLTSKCHMSEGQSSTAALNGDS